jgi:hypothetical protein
LPALRKGNQPTDTDSPHFADLTKGISDPTVGHSQDVPHDRDVAVFPPQVIVG